MPYVRTADDTRLFYSSWGDGPTVVFVHAGGLNGDMWDYQIPPLTRATSSASGDGYFGANPTVSSSTRALTRRQIEDTPLPVLLETHRTFTRADVTRIGVPTLIIHGDADASVPVQLSRYTAEVLGFVQADRALRTSL